MGQVSLSTFPVSRPCGLRVLVVTRDSLLRSRLWDWLRADGHDVVVAHGIMEFVFAVDAIESNAGRRPHLVIFDSTTLEASLADCLAACGSPLRDVPVFVLAEGEVPEQREDDAGANHPYFRRPLDSDDLRAAVMNVEVRRRSERRRRPHRSPRLSALVPRVTERPRKQGDSL